MKDFAERQVLEVMYGKQVNIKFDDVHLSATLLSAELQKITAMTNPPAKRKRDGKSYTPPCLRLNFDVGSLVLVIEDYKFAGIGNGVLFDFTDYQVRITCA
jgi:hypothetical protein